MPGSDWKILFYTYTCECDFMRLVDEVIRDEKGIPKKVLRGNYGKDEFPRNIKERLFDVKLPDGRIFEKCLLVPIRTGTYARAIMLDGTFLDLEHGTELRIVHDKETQKRLEKISWDIRVEEQRQKRIKTLKYRKAKLTVELANIEAQLQKLKK